MIQEYDWFYIQMSSSITIKSLENVFKGEIKIKVAMQIKIIIKLYRIFLNYKKAIIWRNKCITEYRKDIRPKRKIKIQYILGQDITQQIEMECSNGGWNTSLFR